MAPRMGWARLSIYLFRGRALLAALALLGMISPGRAQMVLKPQSGDTAALQLKEYHAEADIEGAFAITKVSATFLNPLDERMEADFLSTLPPHAVATDFAYYYGKERVVARVTEKRRAAAIYKAITTRMRDPALIEMQGKRTFRARIFPVMPHDDLRVEMTMVQALSSNLEGFTYILPLAQPKSKHDALDEFSLSIRVHDDGQFDSVENNYGLSLDPSEETEGMPWKLRMWNGTFAFTGKNYRPTKDFRIHFNKRGETPFHMSQYAGRSGGPDGFFGLTAIVPPGMTHPQLTVAGRQTYDVVEDSMEGQSDRSLRLYGRYRGGGSATVHLAGRVKGRRVTLSHTLNLSLNSEPNHRVTKLWAAAFIAHLSKTEANRKRVIALSLRYTLPSKWTSWLAIPKEERERYKREMAEADIRRAGERLIALMDQRRSGNRESVALRERIKSIARDAGLNPAEALSEVYSTRLNELQADLQNALERFSLNGPKTTAIRQAIRQVARDAGVSPAPFLRHAEESYWRGRQERLAETLAGLIRQGKESSPGARRLKRAVEALRPKTDSSAKELLESRFVSTLDGLAKQVVLERRKAKPGETRDANGERELNRLETAIGIPAGTWAARKNEELDERETSQLEESLKYEITEGDPQGQEKDSILAQLDEVYTRWANGDTSKVAQRRKEALDRARSRAFTEVTSRLAEAALNGDDSEAPRLLRERLDAIGPGESQSDTGKSLTVAEELASRASDDGEYTSRVWQIAEERDSPHPNRPKIAQLEQELARLETVVGISVSTREKAIRNATFSSEEDQTRRELIAELRKPLPDPAVRARLERKLAQQTAQGLNDDRYNHFDPTDYAQARVECIATEVELDQLEQAPPDPATLRRIATLNATNSELRARMGDPLLSVEAPADTRRIVALMPDGLLKPLSWNAATRRWQARFDIPTWASEGAYTVTVFLLRADGSRSSLQITYHVDLTAPVGAGQATTVHTEMGRKLCLELQASEDTARVEAFIGDREPIAMKPLDPVNAPGRFLASVSLTGPPPNVVTYRITDRAHNVTVLTLTVQEE